jgi:6-carboxyhexanoate--CoA ligase
MKEDPLYSIRMHATLGDEHLSGAERLAGEKDLEALAASLLRRALDHPAGRADGVRLSIDLVPAETIRRGRLPDLQLRSVVDWRQGREVACRQLLAAGVSEKSARAGMAALAAGAAPGGAVMRGAMLVDAQSGERLEPDQARGVRVSRMDLTPQAERALREGLRPLGLDNPHVREALVLAAKVMSAPGVIAELCWSDDPDYTAGYVASPVGGYVRISEMKPVGERRGGRAFFVRRQGLDLPRLIDYLQHAVFLVDEIGALGESKSELTTDT